MLAAASLLAAAVCIAMTVVQRSLSTRAGDALPIITFGFLILGLASYAAYLVTLRAISRIGRCRRCGYDLAGLAPGSPCPECGTRPRS